MSTNPQRDEIIRRMDLLAEFQKYGGRVPPNAQMPRRLDPGTFHRP